MTFTLHSRALLMEMIGTFLLCYFSLMVPGNVGSSNGSVYSVVIIAVSLSYGYAHLIGKHISGGLYNPAVTLAMSLTGRMPAITAAIYIFFQFLGGALGGFLTLYIFDDNKKNVLLARQATFYLDSRNVGVIFGQALVVETLGTLMLVLVFLRTRSAKQEDTTVCAAAVGLTQLFIATGGWFLTGWGNNPARIFGITFVSNTVTNPDFWVYYLGPFVAAILAWYFDRYLLAESHGEFASDLKKLGGWFGSSEKGSPAGAFEDAPAPPVVAEDAPKQVQPERPADLVQESQLS